MNKTKINDQDSSIKEKSLAEIFQILYNRKWILIITITFTLTLAYIQVSSKIPVYESKVILKKETINKSNLNNDFMEIVKLQTLDEVETEIELVRTVDVLTKVTGELKLFLHFDRIITSSKNIITLDKPAFEYSNPKLDITRLPFELPQIISIDLKDYEHSSAYYITRRNYENFSIHNALSEELIQSIKFENINDLLTVDTLNNLSTEKSDSLEFLSKKINLNFKTSKFDLNLNWVEVPIGSKFYFTINRFYGVIESLAKNISVARSGKTNLFTVSVTSPSSYAAAEIANVLVDKFRESRIEQQKQTIRYSFNFIDEQLLDMQSKLRESEENLSEFKAGSQITSIDVSSQEVVKFLSTLEAENLNVELQLSEYKNKLVDMKKQLESTGYFDQNLLSPEGSDGPFSNLLTQLSNLELQRLELLQKRTENHPDVISLDEQINLAKKKLASYNQNTLTAYQILINSLEKKKQDIGGIVSKYERKLEALPSQENKFARLFREKTVYEKMFTLLLDKREEMRIAELSKLQDIVIVDPARQSLRPLGSKKLFTLLIALVLGTFVGLILIFIIELGNSKYINLDQLEEDFQIPILSIIPKYTRAIKKKITKAIDIKDRFVSIGDYEDAGFVETYRLLKTKLQILFNGRKKVFMITSCEENTGKSTVVGNLAISFAQDSKRVLIIDCDLRKAGASKIFDLSNEKEGLINYLSKQAPPKVFTRLSKMIDILPAGGLSINSSNLLNSEKMKDLFHFIDSSIYDYIIIDTPPVTRVVDVLILGKYFKDAVLVVRPNFSQKEIVKGGLDELSRARIKVRGIIVNAAELTKSYYYKNRYGYGYGYSYGDKVKESKGIKKVLNTKVLRKKSLPLN